MRGNTAGPGSIEVLVRALLDELPELDPARVRAAVERASAEVAKAALEVAPGDGQAHEALERF